MNEVCKEHERIIVVLLFTEYLEKYETQEGVTAWKKWYVMKCAIS